MTALAAASVLALVLTGCGLPPELGLGGIEVDDAQMAVLRDRLAPLARELDAVPPPAGAESDGPAVVSGCSMDSGVVTQPTLSRDWTLVGPARSKHQLTSTPSGRAAGVTVARALLMQRWIGEARLSPAGEALLTRRLQGRTVTANVAVRSDKLYVVVYEDGPGPCSAAG